MRRAMLAGIILVLAMSTAAAAQPPTYLPWQSGATYRVTQGNQGGYSHNTTYTRYGWDFGMPAGTPVLAAAPGTVRRAVSGCGNGGCNDGWGNAVVVCYGDGTCSRYAHLSSVAVRSNQGVDQGDLVGRVGNTGRSSGAHLHYQLEDGRQNSRPSRFVEAGVPRTGDRVTSRNPGGGTYHGTQEAGFPMDQHGVVHVGQNDGHRVSIGFNLRNSGSRTWGDVRLVLVNDPPGNMRQAMGWETPNQIPGDRQRVAPGQVTYMRFHVNPTDQNPLGDYPFRFRLYDRASGRWIAGVEPSFLLRVGRGCWSAAFVSQRRPGFVEAGTSRETEIALRNTGGCRWDRSVVRLGTLGDEPFPYADGSWLNRNRLQMREDTVAPGGVAHFTGRIAPPAGTGPDRRLLRLAPVADGWQWFSGHIGLYQVILVGPAGQSPAKADDYAAQLVGFTYPAGPLSAGQRGSFTATYRNTGWTSWLPSGNQPVHFRGIRPTDRESRFIDPAGPYVYGRQGISVPAVVHPGETVTLTMPLLGPDLPPGEYPEYFRLVAEGVSWFGPDNNWWPISVR